MVYTFDEAHAKSRHNTQYFKSAVTGRFIEMVGSREPFTELPGNGSRGRFLLTTDGNSITPKKISASLTT